MAGVEPPSAAIETILDAAYACTPTVDQAKQWKRLSKMKWPTKQPRRVVACLGRRAMKTSALISWSCIFDAICGGHEEYAAPGSRLVFPVICPVVAQAREAMRGIRSGLDQLAPLGVRYSLRDASGAPEIILTCPTSRCEKVFVAMAADAVTTRGFAMPTIKWDEWGFAPSADWVQTTGADIVRAVAPAQAQFPNASMMFTSSPGAPQGIFYEMVEKPTTGVLVVRAPTWVVNPRISRETCVELAGDAGTFAQEFEARRFGYNNESFIDVSGLVMGSPHAGKGPRPGRFCIGLDIAQLHDQTAIVVLSGFDHEVTPRTAPIRNVVVEVVEVIESSRERPTAIEAIAARVVDLSKMFGNAPVVFDPYQGPTLKAALEKLGMKEHRVGKEEAQNETVPKRGTFLQRSMAPTFQTPRWRLVRELVQGRRVHLTDDHVVLARQLAQLRATQMSSGSLKVEGKRDDVADAFALAAEVAMKIPATDGPDGAVVFRYNGAYRDEEGVHLIGPRWVRVLPNGREVPAETPRWHPSFPGYARDMVAQGISTPAIEAWKREQEVKQRVGVVPVQQP